MKKIKCCEYAPGLSYMIRQEVIILLQSQWRRFIWIYNIILRVFVDTAVWNFFTITLCYLSARLFILWS